MHIKFTADTHIRTEISSPRTLPIGVVYRGTVIEVEDKVFKGFVIERIDQWYRDSNGWYYWVGSTEIVSEDHYGIAVRLGGGLETGGSAARKTVAPAKNEPILESAKADVATDSGLESQKKPARPAVSHKKSVSRKVEQPKSKTAPNVSAKMPSPEKTVKSVARPRLELESFQEETTVASVVSTTWVQPETPILPPREKTLEFDPEKLNWGAKNYLIAKDWWQENGLTGRGTKLCLLGTGATFNHPDLEGAIADKFSIFGNEDAAADFDGLGTQAAVVAAGRGKNVFGIAPETALLIGKIGHHEPDCRPETLIAGLNWALEAGAEIIVANMDAYGISADEQAAILEITKKATERGVFLICPVGNSVEKRPEDRFPAAIEGWFSVGACDLYGRRCAWSAKSYHLDLLAPGEGILTSNPLGQSIANSKNTAIAASFTGALLALILQKFRETGRPADPKTLLDLLRETAIPNKAITKGNDTEYGFGILNPPSMLSQFIAPK